MSRHSVLFTTERAVVHQQAALSAAPRELDVTMLREPDNATLRQHLAQTQYWISERRGQITADLLDAAPELKLIVRLGSLAFDIDLEAAKSRNIAVTYWPIRSVIMVAEHTIMQMLALTKRLRNVNDVAMAASPEWGIAQRTDEDTFSFNWSKREGVGGLWHKTIGIIGFGEIAVELARRLRTWDVTLLYNKRSPYPVTIEDDLGITYVAYDAIFERSDILINLLPYSESTDQFINAERLSKMQSGSYLVSTGSGSVIDETALANAVRAGYLAGAALDTYEYEPLQAENPLRLAAHAGHNILLTPHTAAGSITNTDERAEQYRNILRHIAGQPLRYRLV